MDDTEIALIAEQIKHALDLLRGQIEAVEARQAHDRALMLHRLDELEAQARDHETRLRSANDGVLQFKVWLGLASGGSGALSLAALLKAFLGM